MIPPPPPPPGDGRGGVLLYSTVSIYGAVFLGLNLVLLGVLIVFHIDTYEVLTREDGLFENLTALLFFLTALLLGVIAAMGRGIPGRWLYVLGALAFAFATGEEISWGQRIFGFATPDYLRAINTQNEFTLHNIGGISGVFNRLHRAGILLLCITTCAAYFVRKSRICGVFLPSILTMYCFLVQYGYRPRDIVGGFPLSLVREQYPLLLFFAAYAFFSRERRLFALSAVCFAAIVLEHFILYEFSRINVEPRSVWEGGEYLFGIACVVYAGELFLTHRAAVQKMPAPARG